ncbi:TonB-dependent receptor [Psychrobacter sanguinis]|uniref:TonB-dependent receptor n=1 Tax=Psychrobacter sanguinis TaxID=861445 RepID=UPI002A751C59|nr:TonB-dependent receptor [Psychrobacter sanguinis]MDY3306966.1 TonB-dependent receptor [Psychrobacter sanguinis]
MSSPNKLALSVLTLCIGQQLYAAETATAASASLYVKETPPIAVFDKITVPSQSKTGTALAQKISEMPAVTQVIYQQDIEQQVTDSRMTSDILAQLVPSLGTGSGSTSNYGTTMRGRPVQYLINGVPLSGSRSLSRELNSIDPSQIERIEVLSGSTSIYGAGAAGGLINIVTKSYSEEGLTGQTRLGVNSNRDFESDSFGYHVGQSIGYSSEKAYGRLDVDWESKGGKFDSHGNRVSPDVFQTDQQDTDSISINANLGAYLTDTQSINLAATYYEDEQDTDYGFDYGPGLSVLFGAKPSLKAIKGVKLDDQPRTEKTTVNLNYNNSDLMGSNLSITGYYRNEEGRYYPSGKQVAGYNLVAQSEADIDVSGVRAVMQTDTEVGGRDTLFSYGVDFEREKSEQTYYGQDFMTVYASNGLVYKPNGIGYNAGPKTTTDKLGVFINTDVDLSDKWHGSAGVRYQELEAETDAFIPMYEQVKAENEPTYQAGVVAAGEADHNKTLFNLGTSYQITPKDLIFANYSQGFTTADVQRALRDVKKGYVVNADNVQPITIDNYELGWQGNYGDTQAKLTGFYNESDKTIQFTKDYTVEVTDTDERVYGAEASLSHNLSKDWQIGGTASYTRGQFKNEGDWVELDATRITPLKGTAYVQYNFDGGSNLRLQALAIDGTDKAYKEQTAIDPKSNAQPVTGYATVDLLGQVQLGKGRLDYGVYNLLNKDYLSVYHQTTYSDGNRLPAAGTNYGISYTIDY